MTPRTNVVSFGARGSDTFDSAPFVEMAKKWRDEDSSVLYFPPGRFRFASSVTLDGALELADGAILVPDSGVTITFSGTADLEDRQAFDVVNGGSISFAGTVRKEVRAVWFGSESDPIALAGAVSSAASAGIPLYAPGALNFPIRSGELGVISTLFDFGEVERYGALGTGTDNDSAAFTAALAAVKGAGRGTVKLQKNRSYRLDTEVSTSAASHIVIDGNGATVLGGASRFRSYFYFDTCSDITIKNVKFDLRKASLPVYLEADMPNWYNVAVYANVSSDIVVMDCELTDLYSNGMLFYNCSGKIDLLRNRHTSGVQTQGSKAEHLLFQTCSADIMIDNCRFDNAAPPSAGYGVPAMFASGTSGRLTFQNNRLKYCGRNNVVAAHQLGAFACYGDNAHVRVLRNNFENCLERGIRLSVTHHSEVAGNYVSMSALATVGDNAIVSLEGTINFLPGLAGIVDAKVHHNTFVDDFTTTRTGVAVTAYDYSIPVTDVFVESNRFVNMQRAVNIAGPYRAVKITRNIMRGSNGGSIVIQQAPGGNVVSESNGVTEAQGEYSDLEITWNTFDLASSGVNPISLDYVKAPAFTGIIGDAEVSNNTIRCNAVSAVQAIVLRGVAAKGRFNFRHNKIDGFAYAFDVANAAEVEISENQLRNITNPPVLDSGGITTLSRFGNRLSGGASRGRAVLVGGTVTVSTAEVRATDSFRLTRVVGGGTQGFIKVDSGLTANGVSFVINSSSATDTSTVDWEIVH